MRRTVARVCRAIARAELKTAVLVRLFVVVGVHIRRHSLEQRESNGARSNVANLAPREVEMRQRRIALERGRNRDRAAVADRIEAQIERGDAVPKRGRRGDC